MPQYNIHEAKTNLSKLINKALIGEEVIIAKSGKKLVKLSPIQEDEEIKLGFANNQVKILGDLNEPLPEDLIKEFYK